MSAALVTWGARTDRIWTVPIAAGWAIPACTGGRSSRSGSERCGCWPIRRLLQVDPDRVPGRRAGRVVPTAVSGPSGADGSDHRTARVGAMTDRTADLDVVVLGGGGHVGLPLSLAFAQAGLRVGIYDTNQATLDRIAAGEMPFMETGADELLREVLPTGRLAFGADGDMIERTMCLVVVIGTPVDEFLGPSMTIFEKAVDQIAPHLRDGALVALRSTVYPGTTGVRRPAPGGSWLPRRRRLLPGADRRGPRARGAAFAAADHRRGQRRAAERADRAFRRPRPPRRSGRRPRKPSWRSSSPTPGGT